MPEDEITELLARARHDDYVRLQFAKGETQAQNSALVPWEQLEGSLRDSNRRFAERVGKRFDRIGCTIEVRAATEEASVFAFSSGEIEELAQAEHARWVVDLEQNGWTYGHVKDAATKRHPLLVGWGELSEEERDKDRDAIRGLPAALVRAGLSIQRIR
jgi:hypothetical protein